ncbi:MAG: phage tail protein [Actinomycetaceae bacterium]|nr:phage tail protein [Actinomycetaceae bacterium]
MITLHDASATRFDATGIGVLDGQIIAPVVAEELNASFSLSFDYPAWGEYAEQLMVGQIVACPVPWSDQKQGFRITAIDTSIEQVLHIEAVHVFFDLAHNLIADTFVVNKTPSQALTQLLGAANYPHSFTTVSSDTGTVASARIVRTSIAAAILDTDEDNSFVNRWGGEFTFDNWQIKHAPRRGSLTGVVIQDRKNLTGYKSSIDTASLVTRILPVGYDGLLLPELYVDSPRINDYAYPFVKVIKFDQVKAIKDPEKAKEDELPLEQAYAKLRELAKAEYAAGVDLPTASYDVSFVDLSSTREYADLAQLERVNLGDTVTVKHTDLGVNLTARVVAYTFNPLTASYISIQLGNAAPVFTSVAKTMRGMSAAVAEASEAAAIALESADGKTTNYYSTTAPAAPHLGDTWFKDEGEAGTSIWYWGITDTGKPGWIPLMAAVNLALMQAELDKAQEEVAQAKTDAAAAIAAGQQVEETIAGLQGELADTAAGVAASQADITALQGDIASLDAASSGYAAQMSTLKNDLAGLDSKLAAAKKDLAATTTTSTNAKARADAAALLAGMLEPGNLVWNPRFRENGLGWGTPAGGKKTIHTTGGYRDAYCSYQWAQLTGDYRSNIYNGYNDPKRMIPTTKGRTYKISIRIRCAQALAAGALKMFMYQGTSTLSPEIPAGTWVEWETTSTITSDGGYQSFTWLTLTGAAVPLNTDIDVCEPYVVEAATEWLIIDGAIKANKIAAGAVDATKIKAGTITSAQIAAGTITSSNIGAYAINASHIQAGAITASELASGAVTTVKLAASAITGEKIAAGTITAQHLRITPGNLWPDPHFLDPCWGAKAVAAYSKTNVYKLVASGVQSGAYLQPAGHQDKAMSLEPGAHYRISCWARFGGTTGIPYVDVYCRYKDTTGAVKVVWLTRLPRTDAVSYKEGYTAALFTMPAASATGECTLGFYIQASMPDGEVCLSDMTVVRAADATLIVDGSVTARSIAAGTITGDKIAASTITATNIKAASITSDKLVIANGFITTAMIKDAAITDAKIGSLSAGKITTGTLAAARIAAGSITSDKLTIANGFIKTAMIADAAITNVKIANVDAAKITTGYLAAARIKAGTITGDKFASNAIQVGLAGWTNSIRITPYQISWYSGSTLQGTLDSDGMSFYYGTRFIGSMGESYKEGNTNVRGITMQLNGQGDFVTWSYRTGTTGTFTSFFTLDPKGSYYGVKGIHLGTDLRTHGWTFFTNGNRGIDPQDATLTNIGTFPAWSSTNNYSKVVFGTSDLYLVTRNTFYNMTSVMSRIKDLMGRVNTLINLLNHGWITSISGSGSNITWKYYSNTGYQAMSTTLT